MKFCDMFDIFPSFFIFFRISRFFIASFKKFKILLSKPRGWQFVKPGFTCFQNEVKQGRRQPVKAVHAVPVPNFEDQYKSFQMAMEKHKSSRLTTVVQPFTFDYTIHEWKENKKKMEAGIPLRKPPPGLATNSIVLFHLCQNQGVASQQKLGNLLCSSQQLPGL